MCLSARAAQGPYSVLEAGAVGCSRRCCVYLGFSSGDEVPRTGSRSRSCRSQFEGPGSLVIRPRGRGVGRISYLNFGDDVGRERLVVGHITGDECVVVSIANPLARVRIRPADGRLFPGIADRDVYWFEAHCERDREAAFAEGVRELLTSVFDGGIVAGGVAAPGQVLPRVG